MKYSRFKIKDFKGKLLLTICYFLAVAILRMLDFSCIFDSLLHIPCPGCGMTRATLQALQGNLSIAFKEHLMFWAMPILYLYFLYDGRLFPKPWIDHLILTLILIGFIVNWIIRIMTST